MRNNPTISTFRSRLNLGVLTAMLTRIIGAILQFVITVFLGRVLGVVDFGIYQTFVGRVAFFSSLVSAGFPTYVLKTIAAQSGTPRELRAAGIRQMFRACRLVLVVTAVVAPFLYGVFQSPAAWGLEVHSVTTLGVITVLAAGALAQNRVIAEAFKGALEVGWALAIEFVAVPVLLAFYLVVALYFGATVSLEAMLLVHVVALFVAGGSGVSRWLYLTRHRSPAKSPQQLPAIERGQLSTYWLLGLVNIGASSLPLLVLPYVLTAEDLGYFAAAFRIVSISSIILTTIASYYAPRFSKSHSQSNFHGLKRSFRTSQFLSIVTFLPFFGILLFLPGTLLTMFGNEFVAGGTALMILGIGQLANSITGLSGHFLNMTGLHTLNLIVTGTMLAILLLLLYLGAHFYGLMGAALAYAICMAVRSLMQYIGVNRILHSRPAFTHNPDGGNKSG